MRHLNVFSLVYQLYYHWPHREGMLTSLLRTPDACVYNNISREREYEVKSAHSPLVINNRGVSQLLKLLVLISTTINTITLLLQAAAAKTRIPYTLVLMIVSAEFIPPGPAMSSMISESASTSTLTTLTECGDMMMEMEMGLLDKHRT